MKNGRPFLLHNEPGVYGLHFGGVFNDADQEKVRQYRREARATLLLYLRNEGGWRGFKCIIMNPWRSACVRVEGGAQVGSRIIGTPLICVVLSA